MEDLRVRPVGTALELNTGFLVEGKGAVKSIVMREMVGHDQDLMMNPKISPVVKMNQILANCIQSIGDIEDRPAIKKLTRKMVGTDRAMALISLRSISLGDDYEYESTCPACGKKDKKIYDLKQVKAVNPASIENLFYEVDLPGGRKARMRVADAEIDEMIEAKANGNNSQTIAIFARMSELDGAPPTIDQVTSLSAKAISILNKAKRQNEGYLDDEIEVECVKCRQKYKDVFEMEPVSFFGL